MPKFLITNGSYYEPFTYDELIKPVTQAVEAHNATQEAYDEISDQAELLRRYVEAEPENSLVRQRYNSYMDKLTSLQENLWRNGFNASTKRDLSAARAGYNSDINRIGTAIKTRQERSDLFHKYRMEHPDAIMGTDPGLASLDEYYKDDLYGKNFYMYSGEQFSKEVAADAKARASELLRNPEVVKDPRMVGYLLRIEKEGFTNQEVNNAINAVTSLVDSFGGDLSAFNYLRGDSTFAGLDEPTKILANVFLSHLQSTGAAGNVSSDQFNKLVRFGAYGLSSAVGDTTTTVHSDKVWDLSHSTNKGSGSGKKDKDDPTRQVRDRLVRTVEGRNFKEINDRYVSEFGKDEVIASASGDSATSPTDAAMKVYSDKERREYYAKSGIDVGLDLRHQKGEITRNGKTYETRYDEDKGQVLFREKGTKSWMASKELTDGYHQTKDYYDSILAHFKDHAPEIYEAAKRLDPETQRRIYKRDEISMDTPLSEYKDKIFDPRENKKQITRSEVYFARRAFDESDYIGRFAKLISGAFTRNDKGEITKTDRGTAFNGTYKNIHEVYKDGSIMYDTVKNPADIFVFDEDGNITNIDDIRMSADGLRNGYFIIGLTNSNKEYAIGIEMLGSNNIDGILPIYIAQLDRIKNMSFIDDDTKQEGYDAIVNEFLSELSDEVGFANITLGRTGNGKPEEV